MVSVGIDVSKGKSTVCLMRPFGEIVAGPMEITHVDSELKTLVKLLKSLSDDVKVVMEATGVYHLPVLTYLKENGIFTAVINPYQMKQYRVQGLRRVKTDKADSMIIAKYGLDNWDELKDFVSSEDKYMELTLLSRQYRHYMRIHVASLQELTHILDYTMPGVKKEFNSWDPENGKDKLSDFVEKYWHYDNIRKKSERQFVESYLNWAKKAIEVLRRVDETLNTILARMQEIAKTLPEYPVVRSMGGVGDVLAPKLIADIGDVRRFHNSKALIAYAGIDAPPYQSGQFIGANRNISKRGSSAIRKTGYEVMRSLKSHPMPADGAVYQFILKKEAEGKPKKVAKMAGLNKFLRIYYARVMEVVRQPFCSAIIAKEKPASKFKLALEIC